MNALKKPVQIPDASQQASIVPLRGMCPTADRITPYDTANMALYTCLLVHEEDGASLEELVSILGFDLASPERDWAMRVTLSHLRRARWVNDRLYPWID